MVLGQVDVPKQIIEPDLNLTPLYKNLRRVSKWIIHPSVKCNTIILLRENIRENLHDLGLGEGIFDKTLKVQSIRKNQQPRFHQN